MTKEKNRKLLDRTARLTAMIAVDIVILTLSYIFAIMFFVYAREGIYKFPFMEDGVSAFSYLQVFIFWSLYIAMFFVFRLYEDFWSKSGVAENFYILAAVGLGTVLCLLANVFFQNRYRICIMIAGILMIPMLYVERYAFRIARRVRQVVTNQIRQDKSPLLIVGAGFFGTYVQAQITNQIVKSSSFVAAFVDDDPEKLGTRIRGVKVVGTTADIPEIVNRFAIREIIIAIPSIGDKRQTELVALCKSTKCRVRMVAPLREAAEPTMHDIRDISIDDILFRPEVTLDKAAIESYIRHKTVLVTGGGGSIGSEICRQIAMFYPEKLIVFDIYENNAYELQCEFKRRFPWLNVIVRIGSVRDKARVDLILEEFHPELVLHTAAHKHVPLMEDSPAEAVKNNVIGTRNVLQSASEHGVQRFVQLSTDKAVNPTNVMGASKRITEMLVQNFAKHSDMKCMTVRFGNVLGSYGSVIPLFEKQIKSGGPVLVTDPEITRYFMTIPEAAQLVLQAGALAENGAIYVLDMGEPVKILELAEKLIRYYGYTPYVDMQIEFIGLRPGEKMYEELSMDDEEQSVEETSHRRIMKSHPAEQNEAEFAQNLLAVMEAGMRNDPNIVEIMKRLVPTFLPDQTIHNNKAAHTA